MTIPVAEIIAILEKWAPTYWAEDWDNVGLLLGDTSRDVRKVLVSLDVTEAVVNEACAGGYDFIICHHPLIHDPLKKITNETATGRKIIKLLSSGIGLYCAHTNIDKAPGGVNDCLFERLGLRDPEPLIECECGCPSLGLTGFLQNPLKLSDLLSYIKGKLNLQNIRFAGDANTLVTKVGICGGDASHSRYWKAALEKNCQVFITGDLRHHGAQEAIEAGIALIDISHYAGEIGIVDAIVNLLNEHILIEASQSEAQIFSHL